MTMKTNNPRSARSLSATLIIAFLVLSVVMLLASGGLQLFFYIQAQQQAVSSQQASIAESAAAAVSNFIQEKFAVLSTTAIQLASPTVTSSEGQTGALKNLLARQSEFLQFAFFDDHDNETASVTRIQINASLASAQLTHLTISDILTLTKKGHNYISPVFFDPATKEPVVFMAVPATDVLKNYQGTMVAELNLISMWNLVNGLKVGNTGYAYVVNSQGTLIAFENTDRALKMENVGNIQLVHEFILHPASAPAKGINVYTGINGARVVGNYAPLGTPEWAVVTELPWQEAYQPVFQVIAVSAGIILLMAFLAGLVGVLLARRLAVPLVDLTKTATRIANGEMQLQATASGAREIASLAMAFNSMTTQLRELINSLEQRVSGRTQDLELQTLRIRTSAEVARDIASAPNLDELLTRSGQLIVDRFKFYHAGIFLLDDKKEFAVLRASPTEAGKQLIANNHRLRVGEQGIVGRVAATGEARIALDTGADAVYFNNPLLPATRSEMALPLKSAEGVLGVLDVQSDQPQAFTQEDIEIIQVMADQLTIAIERTRLLKQVEDQLKEIKQAYREYTRQSWKSFAQTKKRSAGYKFDGARLYPIDHATDNIQETLEADSKNLPGTKSDAPKSQAFPIRLRGQVIGFVNVRPRGDSASGETIAIIEQIADRLASTLENARLTEETRQRAQREHAIAEISNKISTFSDIDSIMRSAVEELGHRLGSSTEVTLELAGDDQE
jgi:GAF domain-containing protein/HAMP domain-containing protein